MGRRRDIIQAREIQRDLPEISHPGRNLHPERTDAIHRAEGHERIIPQEVLPAQQSLQHVDQRQPRVHTTPDYKERGPQLRATEPKPAPSGNIRKNPAINPMAGRADTNQWMGPPPSTTKLDMLVPKNHGDANTEDLSARRAKHMHRDMKKDQRFNPCAGEEVGYSSECGNEREDYENSQYDNRMVPADKKIRAELEWKIKRIKTNVLPKELTTQKAERITKGSKGIRGKWENPSVPSRRQTTMGHRSGTGLHKVQRVDPDRIRTSTQHFEGAQRTNLRIRRCIRRH
jgi:hypothetical protein